MRVPAVPAVSRFQAVEGGRLAELVDDGGGWVEELQRRLQPMFEMAMAEAGFPRDWEWDEEAGGFVTWQPLRGPQVPVETLLKAGCLALVGAGFHEGLDWELVDDGP